ncbi:MAG: GT4 family glycosyltransferase PelF [Pseudonocardia sp.]
MRVTLVTEGTYPIHPGGVSDWCDQLIRGLPEITFDVVALTGSGREPITYEPPPNRERVARIGLWAEPPRSRSRRRAHRADPEFLAAYAHLLEATLRGGPRAAEWVESALRRLRAYAADTPLTAALRSQVAVDLLVDVTSRTFDLRASPTLADALAVTDLVEHLLRPLQFPAPRTDLVHATANGSATLVGLLARWEHDTPVILSEHGVYLRERLLALRASGCGRVQRAVLGRFYARLSELGYRGCAAVLPVSRFNARWALRGGAAAARVQVVHNGVDPAALRPAGFEPRTPTLVYAGRIDPLKDLHLLLRAFALVRERVPGAVLRLFGGVPVGNEGYADSCHALVRTLGLGDAVTFEGPARRMSWAYALGHAVVLSSRSEGLPLTVIEAATCRRAVVGTDVGGMAEAVGDGGLVVPANDVHALADACVRVLTDDALRHRLADAGHRRALAQFTLDRFLADIRAVYAARGLPEPVVLPPQRRSDGAGAPPVEDPVDAR